MTTAAAAAPARFSAPAREGASWARQGAESLVAALKIISDLTAQELALVIGMVRERAAGKPALPVVRTTGRVVAGLTGAGNVLLDLVTGESQAIVKGVKEGVPLNHSIAALADLVPMATQTIVESQKRFLDAIAEHSEELVKAYAEGEPLMIRKRLAKMGRERLECFVGMQKKLLDAFADQVEIATQPGKDGKPVDRSKVAIQLLRESAGKVIDAQKQILDLAVEQLEAANGHAHAKPEPRTTLRDLTRKSVRNFTDAQKSLLDLALKPNAQAAETPKAAAAPRRPQPRKRAPAPDVAKQ